MIYLQRFFIRSCVRRPIANYSRTLPFDVISVNEIGENPHVSNIREVYVHFNNNQTLHLYKDVKVSGAGGDRKC